MKWLLKAAYDNNVAPQFLEYVGEMDARCVGKIIHCYNVEDEKHPKYKSTIGAKEVIK